MPKTIQSYKQYICLLCYIPVLIFVDSPSVKVSTMVARSLAAEDEIEDKSV